MAPSEEPFTAADACKKIAESKLTTSLSKRDLLRPSSSLDSATGVFAHSSLGLRPTSGLADRVSPYTGVTDIANIINASSTSPLAPPLTTSLRAGKATTGSLLDQINRSPSRGPVLPVPGHDPTSPLPYFKTLKDQLKQELRTAVEGRRAFLDNRDLYPKSEGDLQALFDIYNNVPDVLLPSASQFSRTHRRNASDSALFSPIHEDIPPGYYKSHGYDTLRGLNRDILGRRPLSRGLLADSLLDPLLVSSGLSSRGLLHGLTSEYEGTRLQH